MNCKPPLATLGRWAVFLCLMVLVVAVRCWNAGEVFVLGQVLYLDPDCYSRMTRVLAVAAEPGTVLRQHAFENWPDGTIPHTTVPLDYLIYGVSLVSRLFLSSGSFDFSGAIVSVLLAALTAGFLWVWGKEERLLYRAGVLFFFAVGPMLVHGMLLGRPDHQALLIFLLAMALGAEARWILGAGRRWDLLAGAAWGGACWVSLYEPLVLLGICLVAMVLLAPARSKERWRGGALLVAILLVALVIEGWRFPVPDEQIRTYFPNWAKSIGEMQSVSPWNRIWLAWTWLWLPLTPILLLWRRDREGVFWLLLLTALYGLTLWQSRWGYFFSLAFVLSLPAQWRKLEEALGGRRWIVAVVTLVALWPIGMEWERHFTDREEMARRHERKVEALALLETAAMIRQELPVPVLAPWWLTPAFTYWSGHPGVAGSSHQSLPGIVQSARFYTSTDPEEALFLLDERGAQFVLAYEPDRLLATSYLLLRGDATLPPETKETMAYWLYRHPDRPPDGLQLVWSNLTFRLYRRVLE